MVESLVALADGVPIHLYDMSVKGNNKFLAHWETLRQKLPPKIQSLLPSRLPGAEVGVVRNPSVRVVRGAAQLEGDIESENPGIIQGLMRNAKRIGRALGLSIHVDEDNLDATVLETGGVEPTEIRKVTGWDIVSFPSAGGQFLPVLEAWTKEDREMKNLVRRLLALLTDDQREAVTEAVDIPSSKVTKASTLVENHREFVDAILDVLKVDVDEAQAATVLEALVTGTPEEEAKPKPKTPPKKQRKPVTENTDPDPDSDMVTRKEFDEARKETKRLLEAQTRTSIRTTVEDAELPDKLAKFAVSHWNGILESHGDVSIEDVEEFVADLKSGLGRTADANKSALETDNRLGVHGSWNTGDKYEVAFQAMLEGKEFGILEGKGGEKIKVPALTGIRQSYSILTGDLHFEGRSYHQRPLAEKKKLGIWESLDWEKNPFYQQYRTARGGALEADPTTATYDLLLSNLMHKMMVKEYNELPWTWNLVGRAERVTDFKDHIYHMFGEFPNLEVVAEKGLYDEVTGYPSEEDITWRIEKRGGTAAVTYEMIRNDDLAQIRRFPAKMARAAMRTLNAHVYGLLAGTYEPDTVAIAHASHANLISTALSLGNIQAARLLMHQQTDLDAKEAGRIKPSNLLVGPELYDQAYELIVTDGKPKLDRSTNTAEDSERIPNILRTKYGLGLHEVQELDANDYWLVANPSVVDMIVVGFLDGKQTPELFVQDLNKVGVMFDYDQIKYKVRHIYKGVVVDYRPFVGGLVA
jgi:hypothetical protein